MSEFLSVNQVHARYPKEWVLLGDVQRDDRNQVIGGIVLYHGAGREEMYLEAVKLKPRDSATVPPKVVDADSVFMF